jgi:glutamate synthase (NADPH/NADH) small chain
MAPHPEPTPNSTLPSPAPVAAVVGNPKYSWAEPSALIGQQRAPGERLTDFREIHGSADEAAVRAEASRCIQCPDPLCREGCALCNRIPEWLALAAKGDFLAAAEVSQSTSNLPEICARLCPQERLCEGACILAGKTDPVAIGAIERFINDYAFAHGAGEIAPVAPNGFRVAVVDAGAGGLTCADELTRAGCAVTIFDARQTPGGLLTNGVPAFRLDRQIVERRVELLVRRGVEFRMGVELGREISLEAVRREFDAVYLSASVARPRELQVPGAGGRGVVAALPFLIQSHLATQPAESAAADVRGKRVVVLGGGDTAIDCVRTALRVGAREAGCLYRRDLAHLPASRKEYDHAVEEGARFEFLANPVEVMAGPDGAVQAVRCVRTELGEPDSSGRRVPHAIPGSGFTVEADVVVVAFGWQTSPLSAGAEAMPLAVDGRGRLRVDEDQMTSVPGVFAGGDAVQGPGLVVYAVRDARRAAQGMLRFLRVHPTALSQG